MLLKRLSASLPEELRPIVSELEAAGIKTTENLLFTPLPTILSLLDDHEAQYEVEQLIERCLRQMAPVGRSGADELVEEERVQRSGAWTGFGVMGLDGLIGDWKGRGVVEICGSKRVGKSLLALHVVFRRLLSEPSSRCTWLDTDGSFALPRARAVLDGLGCQDPGEILSRLSVSPCYNLDPDLRGALEAIKAEDRDTESVKTTVLVVDSVTPLLKDNLMGSGSQAMVSMMEEVSEIAQTKGLTAIVTNTTASSRPSNPASTFTATDLKPALGVAFSYFAEITLMIQSTGKLFGEIDEGERDRAYNKPGLRGVVEVLKSRISDGKSLFDVIPAPTDDERTMMMSAGQQVGEARPAYGPLRDTLAA